MSLSFFSKLGSKHWKWWKTVWPYQKYAKLQKFWVVVRTQRYQLWRRAQPEETWHQIPHGLHRSFTLPAPSSHHDGCSSPRITGYSQKWRQKRMRSVILQKGKMGQAVLPCDVLWNMLCAYVWKFLGGLLSHCKFWLCPLTIFCWNVNQSFDEQTSTQCFCLVLKKFPC